MEELVSPIACASRCLIPTTQAIPQQYVKGGAIAVGPLLVAVIACCCCCCCCCCNMPTEQPSEGVLQQQPFCFENMTLLHNWALCNFVHVRGVWGGGGGGCGFEESNVPSLLSSTKCAEHNCRDQDLAQMLLHLVPHAVWCIGSVQTLQTFSLTPTSQACN